jgi:hypothetical protein
LHGPHDLSWNWKFAAPRLREGDGLDWPEPLQGSGCSRSNRLAARAVDAERVMDEALDWLDANARPRP